MATSIKWPRPPIPPHHQLQMGMCTVNPRGRGYSCIIISDTAQLFWLCLSTPPLWVDSAHPQLVHVTCLFWLFPFLLYYLFQASLESEITRCGGMLNGFISSTEEILTRFITQYFPTQIIKSVRLSFSAISSPYQQYYSNSNSI